MLTTALAFCITLSCSDRSTTDPTSLALNDSTGDASRIVSATVTLAQGSLQVRQTTQATAVLLDSRNRILNQPVAWSTSSTTVATVSASGLVTAISVGTADIIATRGGKSGSATLTVLAAAPVASVSVALAKSSLSVGQTTQATDTTRDSTNNVLTGSVVTWSTGNANVASVNSTSGLVSAVGAGSTTITATSEGVTGTASLSVTTTTPVAVASVSVSPSSSSFLVGAAVQLSATTLDANGNVLTGRVITWSSANTSIASVNSTGLVTAIVVGSATITATSEGQSGSATVNVQALPPPGSSNEPSGMTFITQRGFDALNEAGWNDQEDTNGGLSIAQDATAPTSPSNIGRMTYPTGFVAGSAPANAGMSTGTSYHTLYVRFAAKLSSNWYGQAAGFSKYFYVWENVNLEGFFLAAHGTGTDPLEPYAMLQGLIAYPPAGASGSRQNLAPNLVPSARIIRGQWQIYEFVLTGNSAGTADGSMDWFLDGVHIGSYTGIQWTTDATVFTHFNWDPVWGGIGPPNVPATQTMDWDYVYLSGKN
jgi:uncharacterized protein YjdB